MTHQVDLTDLAAPLHRSLDDGTLLSAVGTDVLAAARPLATGATPLAGVPFVVKDNIDVVGLPTTVACPPFAYDPVRSASVVRSLVRAGAVPVGKANMDQFATGLVGLRTPVGPPVNPLAPDLVPGGSSSGSAVAVAAGLVPLSLGTDTAGSGRVPAAMTGTVGWKPAPGRLSVEGVVPACWSLDCPSVFAADLDLALVAAGVLDPGRPWRQVQPGVVGVVGAAALTACDPAVVEGYRWVVDALAGRCEVSEVDLDPFLAVGDLLYGGPWLAERTAAIGELIDAHLDEVHPVVAEVVLAGRRWSAVDAYRALHDRDGLAAGPVAEVWRHVDALVIPTVPWLPTVDEVLADPIGTNRRLGTFTHFANLLGLAALAVPVPQAPRARSTVPFGASVLVPPGREGVATAIARLLGGEGPALAPPGGDRRDGRRVELCVVGAHLSGFPLCGQLLDAGGSVVERTTTAPDYRLHRLPPGAVERPALERVERGGAAIDVEVWSLPITQLGSLVAAIPTPLALGSVALADGREVTGFVCELGGLVGAEDITAYGGWRSWWAATHPAMA